MKFNPKALPMTSKALFTIVGGAVLINPVFAQEQSASELDEVVVTGIRGSLKQRPASSARWASSAAAGSFQNRDPSVCKAGSSEWAGPLSFPCGVARRSRNQNAVIPTEAQAGQRAERSGGTSHFAFSGEGGAEQWTVCTYRLRPCEEK